MKNIFLLYIPPSNQEAIIHLDIESIILDKLEKNNKKYPIDKSKGNSKKYTDLYSHDCIQSNKAAISR
jgi:hypothetical protein